MPRKRLFFAIPVPEEVKDAIKESLKGLELPNERFIVPEAWHVTLLFLGEVEENDEGVIIAKARDALGKYPEFRLEVKNIITAGSKKHQMIWMGFEKSPEFEKLCTLLAEAINYPTPRKSVPHITLSRLKNKIDKDLSFPAIFPTRNIEVCNIELWQSKLSSEGAVYSLVSHFKLKSDDKEKG